MLFGFIYICMLNAYKHSRNTIRSWSEPDANNKFSNAKAVRKVRARSTYGMFGLTGDPLSVGNTCCKLLTYLLQCSAGSQEGCQLDRTPCIYFDRKQCRDRKHLCVDDGIGDLTMSRFCPKFFDWCQI